MVDRALFTDMGAAKKALLSIRLIANNLANANTVGFRGDYITSKHHEVKGQKTNSRVSSSIKNTYSDFKPGPLINTGKELDLAIQGRGFIAVQTKEGREAYTRAGNLELNNDGLLVTAKGDIVLGDGGVLTIPPTARMSIDEKGIITAQLIGQTEKELTQVGRIKLVDPPTNQLEKGEDGLFYLAEEGTAPVAEDIKIITGYLEGSNVQPIQSLTELIDLSRNFEVHTKLMKAIEDDSYKANQLLDMEG